LVFPSHTLLRRLAVDAPRQTHRPWNPDAYRQQAHAPLDKLSEGAGGRPAAPLSEVPTDKAQTNFTDPEMKIMPQSNKGWDYGGNAQVVVDDVCQIIVASDVVTETNDKQQAVPMAQQKHHAPPSQAAGAVPAGGTSALRRHARRGASCSPVQVHGRCPLDGCRCGSFPSERAPAARSTANR
jgi:hypothetical protein